MFGEVRVTPRPAVGSFCVLGELAVAFGAGKLYPETRRNQSFENETQRFFSCILLIAILFSGFSLISVPNSAQKKDINCF